jgi:Mg-chelatase subunit ChlD
VRELWTAVFATRDDGGSNEGKASAPTGATQAPEQPPRRRRATPPTRRCRRRVGRPRRAVRSNSSRTSTRSRPEVGELDEEALSSALEDDPDDTLALLADLTGATDPELRELASRLAGRLFLDLAKRGPASPRGVGSSAPSATDPTVATSTSMPASTPRHGALRRVGSRSRRPAGAVVVHTGTAICLLVDRSGSMTGRPLATAAVTAAAVAWRSPDDYSVLSFGKDVVAAKSQDAIKSNERVIDSVLALRGFGTTDVAGALTAAADQLSRSKAGRKITVLLSDCRATAPGDVPAAARRLDELVIVAPESTRRGGELAERVGARFTTVAGPSDAAAALARVLDT